MMMHRNPVLMLAASGVAAGAASGSLVASFGFTELNASFDLASGGFTALSSPDSSGDVTAFGPGASTAVFGPGFSGGPTGAFVELSMDITSTDGVSAQAANGSFSIGDADGDVLTGTFSGSWELISGFAFFSGIVDAAQFDGSGGNGAFDGPDGGSFANPSGELFGALSMLKFQFGDSLFESDFQGRPASVDGMLIPTPGALAILGAAGLVAARRRR